MIDKFNYKKVKKYSVLLLIIVYLIILFPFLSTIYLSIPVSDDFSMAGQIGDAVLLDSLKRTQFFYFNWGGGFPFFFLQFVLNPLVYEKYTGSGHAVGIVLCIFFVLFIICLHIYISKWMSFICNICNKMTTGLISLLFVSAFLNSGLYPEIFYWFVGNSYVWELITALLCQLLIFRLFYSKQSDCLTYVLLCITGFISCFAYQLAVFSGIIYLLVVFYSGKGKKISSYIPLLFMVIGGCISVFAPGNFSRHSNVDASINISDSVINALLVEKDILLDVFSTPLMIALIIVGLIAGYRYVKERKISILALIIFGFVSEFCVLFPVLLGYSSSDLPNRILFFSRFVPYVWLFLISLSLGGLISNISDKAENNKWVLISCCVVTALLWLIGIRFNGLVRIYDIPVVRTALNIESSLNVSREYRRVYETICQSKDKDVVVNMNISKKDADNVLYGPRLEQDPLFWVNGTVARYYGKDSVSVIRIEE